MKLTIKNTLENKDFEWSLIQLLQNKSLSSRASYWIAKLHKKYVSEAKLYDEVRLKTLKKFAMLDEKGDFMPNEKEAGKAMFESEEKALAWNKEYQELLSQEINLPTIPVAYFLEEGVKVEGVHFINLDAVLVDTALMGNQNELTQ